MTAGRKCRAFVSISDDFDEPLWLELLRISDVKRSSSRPTSERAFRGGATKKKIAGYREHGFTFKYYPRLNEAASDPAIAMLLESFEAEVKLDVCFMNSAGIGPAGKGVRGPVIVTKFDRDEADESGVSYDVEMVEAEAFGVDQGMPPLFELTAYEGQ